MLPTLVLLFNFRCHAPFIIQNNIELFCPPFYFPFIPQILLVSFIALWPLQFNIQSYHPIHPSHRKIVVLGCKLTVVVVAERIAIWFILLTKNIIQLQD